MSLTPIQVSTPGAFANTLSASTTLSGVTAGNTIIAVVMHGDRTGGNVALPVSDGQGSYTADVTTTAGGALARVVIARLANAVAGSHVIGCTVTGTAAQSIGQIVAFEVSPVTLDQSNIAGATSGTAASVSATAALNGVGELAIAGLYFDNMSVGGGTFPPTGGPGTYTALTSHGSSQSEAAYQVLSTAAGAGANWGTFTTSSKWAAAIAVYVAAATVIVPTRSLLGVGT
jgi:hypothetical protein